MTKQTGKEMLHDLRIKDTMMKVRVCAMEKEAFLNACRDMGKDGSTVLRNKMKQVVLQERRRKNRVIAGGAKGKKP